MLFVLAQFAILKNRSWPLALFLHYIEAHLSKIMYYYNHAIQSPPSQKGRYIYTIET